MTTNQDLATREVRSPEQQLVHQVRSPLFIEQVSMALPPTVTPERFVRITTTAIIANPDIAKLDHQSVLRALVQCAALGLMPDGKQAAITPRGGKAVLVPMIQGFRDIAADHGWTLRTAVVYANDEFKHGVVDGEEGITHFPVRPGAERGELIAAYAIAKHRDGRRMLTVLHPDDIAKRRASSAYEAIWKEHPAAMWEKSAGRDVFGQLGLAESDERVSRLLTASDLIAGEAAITLYGGPAAVTPPELEAPPAASAVDASPSVPGDERQQADGAAQEPDASAAASSAPDDDEPELGGAQAESQLTVDEAAGIQAAADQAAMFCPPTGKHKNLTLSEILTTGDDGRGWLEWALNKGTNLNPEAYRVAVWSFARVYAQDIYQAALAKHEASNAA